MARGELREVRDHVEPAGLRDDREHRERHARSGGARARRSGSASQTNPNTIGISTKPTNATSSQVGSQSGVSAEASSSASRTNA